jgi:hypothetical protein
MSQERSKQIEDELFRRADAEMRALMDDAGDSELSGEALRSIADTTGIDEDELSIRCVSCRNYGGINRFMDGTDKNSRQVICNAGGARWIPFQNIHEHTQDCQYKSIGGQK